MNDPQDQQGTRASWTRNRLHWLNFVPVLAVVPGIVIVELGLHWLPWGIETPSGLAPTQVWMLESLISGNLAILLLTAWGFSASQSQRSENTSNPVSLGLSAAWTCIGWTTWIMIRGIGSMDDDILTPSLIFSLATLGISVPPLWHAIHQLRRPGTLRWVVAGMLTFAFALQCRITALAPEDPAHLWTLNSALIAGAVAVWLIVISLPTAHTTALPDA